MNYQSIIEMVGNTPIVKLDIDVGKQAELFIKLEGSNPTGAIKDRIAKSMINEKIRIGALTKDKTILGASGGSFGCALAFYGHLLGYSVTVVVGPKMGNDKADFIDYFGGERIFIDGSTIEGNDYCEQILLKESPGKYCFLDQFHDWQNVKTHYDFTGPEILQDLPDVSAIAFSLGTGGSLYGITKYIKDNKPDTKIIAVTADKHTKISGLYSFSGGDYKTPFYKEFVSSGLIDFTSEVSELQAQDGLKKLRAKGFDVGVCSGATLEGVLQGIQKLKLRGKILMISGDSAWKNSQYLRKLIGVTNL